VRSPTTIARGKKTITASSRRATKRSGTPACSRWLESRRGDCRCRGSGGVAIARRRCRALTDDAISSASVANTPICRVSMAARSV
jgi:hypothetical protein